MSAFIDSYALIAWLNKSDSAHPEVCRYLEGITATLITTEWVLMEVADALCCVPNRAVVVEFLEAIRRDGQYEVIGYDMSIYNSGFALFRARADKDWSLTDCISIAVMHERALTDALTADKHFKQAGLNPVFAKAG